MGLCVRVLLVMLLSLVVSGISFSPEQITCINKGVCVSFLACWGGYVESIKGPLSAVLCRLLNPAKGLIPPLQEA